MKPVFFLNDKDLQEPLDHWAMLQEMPNYELLSVTPIGCQCIVYIEDTHTSIRETGSTPQEAIERAYAAWKEGK